MSIVLEKKIYGDRVFVSPCQKRERWRRKVRSKELKNKQFRNREKRELKCLLRTSNVLVA